MATARDHDDDLRVDPDELRHALSVVAEAIVAALMQPSAAPEPPKVPTPPDGLTTEYITTRDITRRAHISTSTLYRWIAKGQFPKPAMSLGVQQPRWRTADYLAWEQERTRQP